MAQFAARPEDELLPVGADGAVVKAHVREPRDLDGAWGNGHRRVEAHLAGVRPGERRRLLEREGHVGAARHELARARDRVPRGAEPTERDLPDAERVKERHRLGDARGVSARDDDAPFNGDTTRDEPLDTADGRVEVRAADLRVVERGVGPVERDEHRPEAIPREARSHRVRDEGGVRDHLRVDVARAEVIEDGEEIVTGERLTPGDGDVVDVDRVEDAIDAGEQRTELGRADGRAAIVAPRVVAVVARLVAERRQLEGDGVDARAWGGPGQGRSISALASRVHSCVIFSHTSQSFSISVSSRNGQRFSFLRT